MKINLGNHLLKLVLFSCWLFVPAFHSQAQRYSVMFNFEETNGGGSLSGVILSGNTLYGTTTYDGTNWGGTIFRINTDGTCFTNLYTFQNPFGPNNGVNPMANPTISGNTLYGTAENGGTYSNGTIFAIQTDGSGYTNLHDFTAVVNGTNNDGAFPYCNLLLIGSTLYGTANDGGPLGGGTVYSVHTDGTGFTVLHAFPSTQGFPLGGLVASGNVLYSTTSGDGTYSFGTVFAMNLDGSGFTNLHVFNIGSSEWPTTNSDGSGPQCGLLLAGNTLYGTTFGGGVSGNGTVFSVKTDGTGFTNLHFFSPFTSTYDFTNSDGAWPYDTPMLHGDTLFATASGGGNAQWGTLFSIKTDGTGFKVYHHFTDGADGGVPQGGVVLAGDTLYGIAGNGGPDMRSDGVAFTYSLAPQLTMTPIGTNLIFSWPTNMDSFDYGNFVLESSANLGPTAVWTNATSPAIVNGNYVVTNSAGGSQTYYRLRGH